MKISCPLRLNKVKKIMGYKCTECDDEYEHESDLAIHVLTEFGIEHNNEITECSLCGKKYKHESDLEMHIMWEEEKAIMTGETEEDWQKFINNPDFDDIKKIINDK